MTTRFDGNNIIAYLHNFDKNHIRQNEHYNIRSEERKFSHEEILKFITKEIPLFID